MAKSVEQFITHWKDAKGGERAQSQSFLNDLCDLLEVERPKDGEYKFEYAIRGDKATDFVDLYKRGCFVLESKQSRAKGGKILAWRLWPRSNRSSLPVPWSRRRLLWLHLRWRVLRFRLVNWRKASSRARRLRRGLPPRCHP
jgi:hypothetical protein